MQIGVNLWVWKSMLSDEEVESIARAAAIWRPLEPSQDALAREGLAFLDDLFSPG